MTRACAPRRLSRLVSVAALAAFAGLAANARADEPIPPQIDTNPASYPPPSTRTNLLLVGAGVTVGWYGVAFGTSYLWPDSDGASSLRIPVAGPYMALAKTGCSDNESSCNTFTVIVRTILTSLSAVGQTGGLLVMLEGAFVPTQTGTAAPAPTRPRNVSERPFSHVAVAPAPVGASGLGVGVLGEF
jgi:hypothetical protein